MSLLTRGDHEVNGKRRFTVTPVVCRKKTTREMKIMKSGRQDLITIYIIQHVFWTLIPFVRERTTRVYEIWGHGEMGGVG
ncbi:hypothetical protein SADUNF_Sadunf05G0154400 [Salix dunnii]|uniref:Uncharacterized protein n=1 Tax=Salix dunnii TaxID=1413687 RepID=A0A835K5E5_9ROSI|nr:hypothetical protein SADUNF_Sadunf05G0154400 [Salix dunnii]